MKALTICQPYAALICLPDSDPWAKRIENRTWPTNYRGRLAIHAGKSKQWMNSWYHYNGNDRINFPRKENLVFGAIVATCDLVACLHYQEPSAPKNLLKWIFDPQWQWVRSNRHAEGPWMWILQNVEVLDYPFFCKGAQGLWNTDLIHEEVA